MMKTATLAACCGALLNLFGCSGEAASTRPLRSESFRIVLIEHVGDSDVDERIRRRQAEVARAADPVPHLERLGALFVDKARRSYDSGYYKLAERCADCIEEGAPEAPSALLLRGHVLHSLHRFRDAEQIARKLVVARGGFLDHGLLGDVLYDQGKPREALASYRKMLELKPCLQSYARAAQVRWLRGDRDGARTLLQHSVRAGSVRAPEALSWTWAKLARLELESGRRDAAARAVARAIDVLPTCAPALLLRAQLHWDSGRQRQAIADFAAAARVNPLPEYRWAHADALRRSGDAAGARAVEHALERTGAREDPRTFALYKLTRGGSDALVRRLVDDELAERRDVFTLDAHAWALLSAGRVEQASAVMRDALALDTDDPRLLYHAGAIAASSGEVERARKLFDRAHAMGTLLMPSELDDLRRRRAAL